MALKSIVTWVSPDVNNAGYARALVKGEYAGPVTYKPGNVRVAVGDEVDIGISCKYDKARQREYINFIILGLSVEDAPF